MKLIYPNFAKNKHIDVVIDYTPFKEVRQKNSKNLSDQVLMIPAIDPRINSEFIQFNVYSGEDVEAGEKIGKYRNVNSWLRNTSFFYNNFDFEIPVTGRLMYCRLNYRHNVSKVFTEKYCVIMILAKNQKIKNDTLIDNIYQKYFDAISSTGWQRRNILSETYRSNWISKKKYTKQELNSLTIDKLIIECKKYKNIIMTFEEYCQLYRRETKMDFPIEESYTRWYEL